MRIFYLLTFFLVCTLSGNAQFNLSLLSNLDYTAEGNDIWGWVDPDDGTEYALMGLTNGFSVVSIADPANPIEVAFFPGPSSTWRDIKTWGEFAYVTNETSNGVLIVDLTGAPDNITARDWTPNIPGYGDLTTCHNIYIDEFGYAYLAGCNLNSGGNLIIDVHTTPGEPIFAGATPPIYSHDAYARENILYTSDIYVGEMTLYDVSDKTNLRALGKTNTPFNFTHNVWLSDDGNTAFTTDERADAPVGAYDISDPTDIQEIDQFRPIETLGAGVIPHNVHVWDDYLIISYYTDGCIIADASRPNNIIEVGSFDTHVNNTGGFFGAWGAYPFLPSRHVLVSDIQNGLYVLEPNYVRAAWLEGNVRDSITRIGLSGVEVNIDSPQANFDLSDIRGDYKTGQAIPGTFEVTYSRSGYTSKTISVSLANGVLTELDVELVPLTSVAITTNVVHDLTNAAVPNAQVQFTSSTGESYTGTTNSDGTISFPGVFADTYDVIIGAWGFLYQTATLDITSTGSIGEFRLTPGYQDDFVFDYDWTTVNQASTGNWELGEPIGTQFNNQTSNPDLDLDTDLGDQCYVTGNGGGDAGSDDVDNGAVQLISPPMDLRGYNAPELNFSYWFFNAGGNVAPNDSLVVQIWDGNTPYTVQTITANTQWTAGSTIQIADLFAPSADVRVSFTASDRAATGNLVEAGIDAFSVTDASPFPFLQASVSELCAGETVAFTAPQQDSVVSWEWTFTGGTPATADTPTPTITYNTAGTYTVDLTITTQSGASYSLSQEDLITVGSAPVADFTFQNNSGTVIFSATNNDPNNVYFWDLGDGTTSTQGGVIRNYELPGTYEVELIITNSCGADTTTQFVEIPDFIPNADVALSGSNGCVPYAVTFSDNSTGQIDGWEWFFPGGNPATSTDENPEITYDTPGVYGFTMIVSNDSGSDTLVVDDAITINLTPSISANQTAIDDNTFAFTANSPGDGNVYFWNFGDGSTSNQQNPTHTYGAAGAYEVIVTVSNACGSSQTILNVDIFSSTSEALTTALNLNIAPNPFQGSTFVQADLSTLSGNWEANLMDALGRTVQTFALDNSKQVIEIQNLEAGIYFLNITDGQQTSQAIRLISLK